MVEWIKFDYQDFPDIDGIVLVEISVSSVVGNSWLEYYAVSELNSGNNDMIDYAGTDIGWSWLDIKRYAVVTF